MNETNNSNAPCIKSPINKKKLIIIIAAISLICATAFLIFWNATEYDRELNQKIKKTQERISEFRENETNNTYRSKFLPAYIFDEYHTDEKFIGFLCTELQTMCHNGEYALLGDFVYDIMIDNDIVNIEIIDTLVHCFENASSLEQAFGIKNTFEPVGSRWSSDTFYYWDKIQPRMILTRNTAVVAKYLETNQARSFTMVPGEGYYAEFEDTSSKDVVGLPDSPLYDSESLTYFGDFKCRSWHGVKLNEYYEEVSYGGSVYYFRDNAIHFDPTKGECVWSGEYLFCFDNDGTMIGYELITQK